MVVVSGRSSKNVPVAVESKPKAVNPFEETFEASCAQMDSEDEFAATGIANGSPIK